jgi:hypothetical protein
MIGSFNNTCMREDGREARSIDKPRYPASTHATNCRLFMATVPILSSQLKRMVVQ